MTSNSWKGDRDFLLQMFGEDPEEYTFEPASLDFSQGDGTSCGAIACAALWNHFFTEGAEVGKIQIPEKVRGDDAVGLKQEVLAKLVAMQCVLEDQLFFQKRIQCGTGLSKTDNLGTTDSEKDKVEVLTVNEEEEVVRFMRRKK